MERFEQHQPKGLVEISELEIDKLSPEDLKELIGIAILEARETLRSVNTEIESLDDQHFSLDAYYELQDILIEYEHLIDDLGIEDKNLADGIASSRNILREKNPISKVAENNHGYILLHSSDLRSLENLITTKNETAEVCTTANSLQKKNDIFQSKTKLIEAGLVYDPQAAIAWFSKDVGSHTDRGKRVLEKRFQEFTVRSLDEAIEKQEGERIEAWLDAARAKPIAILIIDEEKIEESIRFGQKYNLPVLFNSHFFESEFATEE